MHRCINKSLRGPRYHQRGFSAIELLTVLIIIAILAAIVYPSYLETVRKARRAEGRSALMKLMMQQERYYIMHNRYLEFSASSIDGDARAFQWFSGDTAAASSYEISATACNEEDIRTCVLLTAKPGTSRVNSNHKDTVCSDLGLTSNGEKTARLPTCW